MEQDPIAGLGLPRGVNYDHSVSRCGIIHADFQGELSGGSVGGYGDLVNIGDDLPLQPTGGGKRALAGDAVTLAADDVGFVQQVGEDGV